MSILQIINMKAWDRGGYSRLQVREDSWEVPALAV